jgi:hypothetical protein
MAKIKLAADFSDFLKLCLRNKVRFLVIGGYAVIHHSRPRYTGDLDLWIDALPPSHSSAHAPMPKDLLANPDHLSRLQGPFELTWVG